MFKDFKYLVGIILAICFMAWVTPAKAEVEKPPAIVLEELNNTIILHVGTCNWKNAKRSCVVGRDQVNGTFYMYVLDNNGFATHVVRNVEGIETVLWVRRDQFL